MAPTREHPAARWAFSLVLLQSCIPPEASYQPSAGGSSVASGDTGSSSSGAAPVCGDGIVGGAEACDSTDLSGQTCATHLGEAFDGTLTCTACAFDETDCVAVPAADWLRNYGDAAGQFVTVDVDPRSDGGLAIAGSYYDSTNLGCGVLTGSSHIVVGALDAAGGCVRSKDIGTPMYSNNLIAQSPTSGDGMVVTGRASQGADLGDGPLPTPGGGYLYVAAYDAAGTFQWKYAVSGQGFPSEIVVDRNGDVLVTGQFLSSMNFGSGTVTADGRDIFLLRIAPGGALKWVKTFGSTDTISYGDQSYGLGVDGAGNVYITGAINGAVDFLGQQVTPSVGEDAFVASVTSGGAPRWMKTFGGANAGQGYDRGVAVVARPSGDGVYLGACVGGADHIGEVPLVASTEHSSVVASIASDGTTEWARAFSADVGTCPSALGVRPNGDIVVTGTFSASITLGTQTLISAGDYDVYVAELSPAGVYHWAVSGGGPGEDRSGGVVVLPNGKLAAFGSFETSFDLGGKHIVAAGLADAFVGVLGP